MSAPHLLLIEDNPQLNSHLARQLRQHYHVDQVATLSGAYNYIAENTAGYEVVLLDRVLPDGDGLELVSHLQTDSPQTKICVMSTKDELSEKIHGLQIGADAYLPKPVQVVELEAELQALTRRGKICSAHCLHFGDLQLEESTRLIHRQSQQVTLSRRELDFLSIFFRSSDGRATRDQLTNIFWRHPSKRLETLIHVNIQRLRRRLQPLGVGIHSVYDLGYQLVVQQYPAAESV